MHYFKIIVACLGFLLISGQVVANDSSGRKSPKPIVLIEGSDIYYLGHGRQLDPRFNHMKDTRKLMTDVPLDAKPKDLPWLYGPLKGLEIGLVSGMGEVLRKLAGEGNSFYVHAPLIAHQNQYKVKNMDRLLETFQQIIMGTYRDPVFLRAHNRLQNLRATNLIFFRDLIGRRPDLQALVKDREHLAAVLEAGGFKITPEPAKPAPPPRRPAPPDTSPPAPLPLRPIENSQLGRHVAQICALICDDLIRSERKEGRDIPGIVSQLVEATRDQLHFDRFTAEPSAIEAAIQAHARGAYGTPPTILQELLAPTPPPPPAPPPVAARRRTLRAFLGDWLTDHFEALKAEWVRRERDLRDLTDRRIAEIILHEAKKTKNVTTLPNPDVLTHNLSVAKSPELRRPPGKRSFPQSYLEMPSRRQSRFDAARERADLLDIFSASRQPVTGAPPPLPVARPVSKRRPDVETARSFFVRWMNEHWEPLREEWLRRGRPLNQLTDRRIAEIISEEGKRIGMTSLSDVNALTKNLDEARRSDLKRPVGKRVFPKSYLEMPPRSRIAFDLGKERADLLEIFAASEEPREPPPAAALEPQPLKSIHEFIVWWMKNYWEPVRTEWLRRGKPLERLTRTRLSVMMEETGRKLRLRGLPNAEVLAMNLPAAEKQDRSRPQGERELPETYLSRPSGSRGPLASAEKSELLEILERVNPNVAWPAQVPPPSSHPEHRSRPSPSRDLVEQFMPPLLYAVEAAAQEKKMPLKRPTAEAMAALLADLLSNRAVAPQPSPRTLRTLVWRYMARERPGRVSIKFSDALLAEKGSVIEIARGILDTIPVALEYLPPVWEWMAYRGKTRGTKEEILSRLARSIAQQIADNSGGLETPPEHLLKHAIAFLGEHPEAFRSETRAKLSGLFALRDRPEAVPPPAVEQARGMRDYRRNVLLTASIEAFEELRDLNDTDRLFRRLIKEPGFDNPRAVVLLDIYLRHPERPHSADLSALLHSEGEAYSPEEVREILGRAALRALHFDGLQLPAGTATGDARAFNQIDDPKARTVALRLGVVRSAEDTARIEKIRSGMTETEKISFDEALGKGLTIERARARALRAR